jgi:hypothetical protein
LKNAGNRSINQICLKRLTGILNLDELVKKIHQPTKKNEQEKIEDEFDLQEEDKDKEEDKKTTESLDWDKVIYDNMQGNGHQFSVKYSQFSDKIGDKEWVGGEMNTLSNIGSHQIVNLSYGAKQKEKKSPRDF